ncbi:hypothetical protein [Nocardioides dongkuii]|uniref:hypothetical protein n=1 Tax=Nocardioides dongkuii TaxID=2760089 RepID=UPI0015F79B8D|nr:hypothetical protein [Nocardioides dongkuii]
MESMESAPDPEAIRNQLRDVERGELVSWVVYPPTPIWWPVLFGLWAASFALAVGLLDGVVRSLVQLATVLVLFTAVAWDRKRRGTYPSGRPPRELTRPMLLMVLGCVAVAGTGWAVGEQVDVWWAAVVVGLGGFGVVAWYEHEYAAVAARLRERLS